MGAAAQHIYRDDSLPGYGLLVGSGGTKSFFIERRINGRVKRISLGRYGHLTPVQAKLKAQEMLGNIAMGKDPAAEKRAIQAKAVTLQQVFDDYLLSRKDLKPGTVANYQKCLNGCLGDWRNRHMIDISKEMVETRHRELDAGAAEQGRDGVQAAAVTLVDGASVSDLREQVRLVRAAVVEMSAVYGAVIELVHIQGLSHRETARLLDISEGTVGSRLHRGMQKLRDILVRMGSDLSVGWCPLKI